MLSNRLKLWVYLKHLKQISCWYDAFCIWLLSSRYFTIKLLFLRCCLRVIYSYVKYCCVKLTLSKCWFNIEQEIIWSGTGKTFEPGLTFFLLIIENWTDIPCKACNINTRKKCIIAVIHSGICCFTLRSFTRDEFTSLKSMLPFWKFIYDKLRFTCFEHYLFMYSLFRAGNSKWSAAFKY